MNRSFVKKSSVRDCADILEEVRTHIFNKFWNEMNWDQRKIFVASHVVCKNKKKCTVQNDSRRKGSFEYLVIVLVKKVCKKMFLNTLSIGPFSVRSWVRSSQHGMHKSQDSADLSKYISAF